MMTFVGVTGCSVKIVCQATFPDGKLPDDDRLVFINGAYRKLFYIYSTQLQMAIDKIQPTLESSCCVSVDPDAIFREDAVPLIINNTENTPSLKPLMMPKKLMNCQSSQEEQSCRLISCFFTTVSWMQLTKPDLRMRNIKYPTSSPFLQNIVMNQDFQWRCV